MEHKHVFGLCDSRFSQVREAFEKCFHSLGETGAAVAVYYRGELVCDLWGGTADGQTRPWLETTLAMPYSVSKPMAALCCLILIDRGLLSPSAPVVEYWPEFGAEGKAACTVKQLLEHRAGIPFVPPACGLEEFYDAQGLIERVASQAPVWQPGETLAEHAMTYGHLCGALVQRITSMSLGSFFRREVAEPLGVDMYFGLPADRLPDCAQLSSWPEETISELKGMSPLAERGLFQPDILCQPGIVNSPEWRQAEIPAVNLHTTARGVAKVYAALSGGGELGGTHLLNSSTAALLQSPSDADMDQVFGFEAQWALGFQYNLWEDELGNSMGNKFGLGGIGGSEGFGSCYGGGVGFAYITREMGNWDRAEVVEAALQRVLVSLNQE